jgi:dynein heavy chain
MATTDKSGGNVKKVSEGKGGKKQDVKAKLEENNEKLDKIQKRLDDYMETKRRAFPRFYFLSSDELIDILANSRNMDIIQGHLKTCFDNIVRLEVDEEELQGMYSNEKEYVKFFKPRSSGRGGIEKWLCEVQEEMIATLRKLMKEANKEYAGMDRKKFVMERKGQIVATVAQIQWCATTEQALNELINDPFAMQQWLDINIQ